MKNPLVASVNINGKLQIAKGPLHEIKDLSVSVFDRGFLYGDSLYEVLRTYDGIPFELDAHLERITESAHLARMDLKRPITHYRQEILKTLEFFQDALPDSEAYLRIIITRGAGRIGFGLSCLETLPQTVILVMPLQPFMSFDAKRGMSLEVSPRLRCNPKALDPAMKSGNYLNSLLAYLEANDKGFDDALLCNADGHITEGTTFNIFYARNGILATPPLDIGILNGISRKWTLQIAKQLGMECREVRFPKERLYEADEIFITSSIREVFPVTQIDRRMVRGGKPGPLSLKLCEAFHQTAAQRCREAFHA